VQRFVKFAQAVPSVSGSDVNCDNRNGIKSCTC